VSGITDDAVILIYEDNMFKDIKFSTFKAEISEPIYIYVDEQVNVINDRITNLTTDDITEGDDNLYSQWNTVSESKI
jgi:hypothetical protein